MRCNFFGQEFDLSKERFAALLPHERTEFAMLLRERGCVHHASSDVRAALDEKHAYDLPVVAEIHEEEVVKRALPDRLLTVSEKSSTYPKLARAILMSVSDAGDDGADLTPSLLMRIFGASNRSVNTAVNKLRDGGLIVCGRAYRWVLTERGREVVAELQARAAS